MTLLSMLDRFEQAAVTYETSTDKADRDELHAARRAIMEAFTALEGELAGERRALGYEIEFKSQAVGRFRAAEAREAELVKALEPFAKLADHFVIPSGVGDLFLESESGRKKVRATWFRRARAAINPSLEQE